MQLAPQPPSVQSRVVRRNDDRTALIQTAGKMFRPRLSAWLRSSVSGTSQGSWSSAAMQVSLKPQIIRPDVPPTGGAVDALRPPQRSAPGWEDRGVSGAHEGNPAGWLRRRRPPGYAAQPVREPRVPGGGRYGRNLRAR